MKRLLTPFKMTEDSQFQSREENGSRLHIIPLIFSIFSRFMRLLFSLLFIFFQFLFILKTDIRLGLARFYLFLKTHNLLGLARSYGVEAMKVSEP